jgi:alkylation response protein AidB-like acyl-CoA dehydrogenase
MIDFELTDEQKQLKETCRRFAENEVKPRAAAIDRITDPRESFPRDLIRKGFELGFHTLLVPEQYGGMGGGLLDFSIMMEELAAGDAGYAFSFAATCAISRMIAANATPEQCERWLVPFCEDRTGAFSLGFGGTEPSGGTEIFYAEGDPKFGTRTTARREGDHYVINGSKVFITNAGQSRLYGCMARTDKSAANFVSNSIFFFPSNTPGFAVGKIEDKMGHRASSNGELVFNDMKLSKNDMLGEEGKGVEILLHTYHGNSVGMGALGLGVARAAYEMALAYAKERHIWGQPIIRYQAVATMLVNAKLSIESARLLIQRIAWASDSGRHGDHVNPSLAKICASEVARKVTVDAMQVLGGYGYMKDYPAEKLVRDSMVIPIYDGTNEVLRHFTSLEL